MSKAKSGKKKKDDVEFRLPPHANAQVHAAIMKELRAMTPEEIFQTAVEAGIYTKTGKLRKPYATQPDDHLFY
jgi:hypothetical protein